MKTTLKEASKKLYRATRKARRDFENQIAMSDDRRLLYGYIKSKTRIEYLLGPSKTRMARR